MRFIIAAVVLLVVVHSANAEPPKPVKGTRVIVTAPSGFVAAERFPGYMSEETGSSLMVTEFPAPFAEVSKGFDAAGLAKGGMTLLTKADASYGADKGVLISVSQTGRGVVFLKWMAAFGDEKTTYMVTATFPKDAEAELSDVLKKTVMDARLSTAPADPFEALTFRVSPVNDMKIAKVIGNSILLSKGGLFPAKGIVTPILVVGASASKGLTVPDKKAFAEARLQKTATLKDIRTKTTEAVTVDGLDGFESIAEAVDADTGAKAILYQVVLFDTDGYYLIQGIASELVGQGELPTFKTIARTFKKAKSNP